MAARLQYLLITVTVVALENSSLVIHKILGLFVNTVTVDENHYLLTLDNLTRRSQEQLSTKAKNFFSLFSLIFKIYIKI